MEKHIADRILKQIIEADNWLGDAEIAKIQNITRKEANYWILEIQKYKPFWIRILEGFGDDEIRVILVAEKDNDLKDFLRHGGFGDLIRKQEEKEKRVIEMEVLQKNNLIATTNAAKESVKRSRNAERIAWIAAAIAGLSLILQILSWWFSLNHK